MALVRSINKNTKSRIIEWNLITLFSYHAKVLTISQIIQDESVQQNVAIHNQSTLIANDQMSTGIASMHQSKWWQWTNL